MISKIELKENKLKINLLIYIILFVICFGVSNTNIYYNGLMPFGIGIVFALIYLKFNGFLLSIIYFLAYTLAGLSIDSIFEALNVVIILCVIEYLRKINKLKLNKWFTFVFALVAQIVFLITNLGTTKENLALFISITLGLLFLYSSMCFFDATLNRGMLVKLNLDEKICGSVILIIFMVGLSSTKISIINLGLIFTSLIILVSTYITTGGLTLFVSALIGIAISITSLNPAFISLTVVLAIVSVGFKCNFKYLSIIALVLTYIIFSLFFNYGITYGEVISISIGGMIFAFIPLKILQSCSSIFEIKHSVLTKNIINRSKKQICKRVDELSLVFSEMDKVYRDMVKGVLPDDKAKIMLKEELVSSVCEKCENKDICYRGSRNFIENSIDTLLSIAYEKGKVLLIDLPQHLSSNCIKINQMLNTINGLVGSYKEYTGVISNLDSSRLLIANQLNGVSKLLKSLSKEVDVNISFDSKFENRIKEELSYKNIICLECAVYEKDIQSKYVNLIIKTDTINEKIIEKITSKILNSKLIIKSIEHSEIPGASLVNMVTSPNYDVAFGSSSVNKTGKVVSGDSRSLIKIDDGKFMVSICDGMGSGTRAHETSKLTISLIENFYKAGFDNDTILNSVNKLLSLTEEENFSTIDLCIIDGNKNTYDFIKLGATTGYLKRDKGECEIIDSSGLPIGVLEDIKPHITKKLIQPFDMLVFVSDGVTDSFENKVDLAQYISYLDIINPLTLSKEILNKALSLSDNIANDDMTVVCVRVFNVI